MIPPRTLEQAAKDPGPGEYEPDYDIEQAEAIYKGSAAFHDPVPKKIVPVNLYNPHAEPDNDKNK